MTEALFPDGDADQLEDQVNRADGASNVFELPAKRRQFRDDPAAVGAAQRLADSTGLPERTVLSSPAGARMLDQAEKWKDVELKAPTAADYAKKNDKFFSVAADVPHEVGFLDSAFNAWGRSKTMFAELGALAPVERAALEDKNMAKVDEKLARGVPLATIKLSVDTDAAKAYADAAAAGKGDEYRQQLAERQRVERGAAAAQYSELEKQNLKYPMSSAMKDFQDADGYLASSLAFLKGAPTIVNETVVESLLSQGPFLALTRVFGPSVAGAGSFAQDFNGSIKNYLATQGVNIADGKALGEAFQNKELMGNAFDYAATHGATTGGFDAFSGGIAGRVLPKGANVFADLAAQGAAQGVVGAAGSAAASVATGDKVDPKDLWLEFIGEFGTAPVEAGHIVHSQRMAEQREIRKAKEDYAHLEKVTRLMAGAELLKRNPKELAAFVAHLEAQHGTSASLFVDTSKFSEALAQTGQDFDELAAKMPSLNDSYFDALSSGVVEVKTSELLPAVAGTPVGDALLQHLRAAPAAMSLAEAQQAEADHEQRMASEAERALAKINQTTKFEQSSQRVYEGFRDAIEATGRYSKSAAGVAAKLQQAFYATQADQYGMLPEEFLHRYPVSVLGQQARDRRVEARAAGAPLPALPPIAAGVDLSPTEGRSRTMRDDASGASLLYRVEGGEAIVESIRVDPGKRGQGAAKAALSGFAGAADAAGLPVRAEVAPTGRGVDAARLPGLFAGAGFGKVASATSSVKGAVTMRREPRQGVGSGHRLVNAGATAPARAVPDTQAAGREAGQGNRPKGETAQGAGAGEGGGAAESTILKTGQGFSGFFTNLSRGAKGKPKGFDKFKPTINVDPIADFVDEYNTHRGNFDDHIGASIPTFRELQTVVGAAIAATYSDADMLDIGASEGALVKTITKVTHGGVRTVALDPNFAMRDHFESGEKVTGAVYDTSAFGYQGQEEGSLAWEEAPKLTDRDGSEVDNPHAGEKVNWFKPDRKFDIVHEAMCFQFIGGERDLQVGRVKEVMKPGGVAIFEEKFVEGDGLSHDQFWKNEDQKDEFKNKFFSQAEIEAKAKAVGVAERNKDADAKTVGMSDLMKPPGDFEAVLRGKFAYVVQFWDSGNFKGYVASDDGAAIEKLVGNMLPTDSEFSNVKTPRVVANGSEAFDQQAFYQRSGQDTWFYSPLFRALETMPQRKGPLAQMLATIKKQRGYKKAEADWRELDRVATQAAVSAALQGIGMSNAHALAVDIVTGATGEYLDEIAAKKDFDNFKGLIDAVNKTTVTADDILARLRDEDNVQLDTIVLGELGDNGSSQDFERKVREYAEERAVEATEESRREAEDTFERRQERGEFYDETSPWYVDERTRENEDDSVEYYFVVIDSRDGDGTGKEYETEEEAYDDADDLNTDVGYKFRGEWIRENSNEYHWSDFEDEAREYLQESGESPGGVQHDDPSRRLSGGGHHYSEVVVKWLGRKRQHGKEFTNYAHFEGIEDFVGHFRGDFRKDADGKTVFYIDEIQSDWAQEGREKGFRNEVINKVMVVDKSTGLKAGYMLFDSEAEARAAVSVNWGVKTKARQDEKYEFKIVQDDGATTSMPFAKTDVWGSLLLKRAIAFAVEHGAERVALSNGKVQNARWNLATHVSKIEVSRRWEEGEVPTSAVITPFDAHGSRLQGRQANAAELDKYIGKQLASEALAALENDDTFSADAEVMHSHGENLAPFYDTALAKLLTKLAKDFGGKVTESQIEAPREGTPRESKTVKPDVDKANAKKYLNLLAVDVTPELKAAVDQGLPLYQKPGVRIQGEYNPYERYIALLDTSDLSTFLHESAHGFLELTMEMASTPDAPQRARADADVILKWFGLNIAPADFVKMPVAAKRKFHEQYANSFERYLFEGKAPTVELQKTFDTFVGWLKHVYKSLKEFLLQFPDAGKLNDSVRETFDRLLATDEEIEQAKQVRGVATIFGDTLPKGVSQEDFDAWREQQSSLTSSAEANLNARKMRDAAFMRNVHSREAKRIRKENAEKRNEVRSEVVDQVDTMPVYRLLNFLRKGFTQQGVDLAAVKLNTEQVSEIYPPGSPEFRRLTSGGKYALSSRDGGDIHAIASAFGFNSAEDMLASLLSSRRWRDEVEDRTDAEMLHRYGDITSDAAVAKAADEAIHSRVSGRVVATELAILDKMTNAAAGGAPLLSRAAKAYAVAAIGKTKVRDVRPLKYSAAEARAAGESQKAFKAGDGKVASAKKREQLAQHHLTSEAYKAQAEIAKILRYLQRFGKQAARKNMGGEALLQLDALLARFDLRTGTSLKEIDAKTASLAAWVKQEAERVDAVEPDIEAWIEDESYRKSYKELTVNELRGLRDAVQQLETLARRERKMYKAVKNQTFKEERDAILAKMREKWPGSFGDDGSPNATDDELGGFNPKRAAGNFGSSVMGGLLNIETIAKMLEAGEKGPVHDSLFGRLTKASEYKAKRLGEIYDILKPFFDAYDFVEKKSFGLRDIGSKQIGVSITREQAVVATLLWGNPQGRQRLENYPFGNAKDMEKIFSLLDERDLALINGVWAMFDDNMWPEVEALNKRTRGKAPPKVEATPFTINGVEMRGGYFPLAYAASVNARAEKYDAEKSLADSRNGYGISAKTRDSASKERVEKTSMKPLLSLSVMSNTVGETLHDVAFREAVADTMRIVNDETVRAAIVSTVGYPTYRALRRRVGDIAARPYQPEGVLDKLAVGARRNTVVTLLSGFKTALLNFTGLVPALAHINPAVLVKHMAKFYADSAYTGARRGFEKAGMIEDRDSQYAKVVAASEYMKGRFTSYERDLYDAAKNLSGKGSLLPSTSVMLGLMGYVDRSVAVPVWLAAYEKEINKAKQRGDSDGAAHDSAVSFADHVIRQSQASGREVDVPAILSDRNPWWNLFTMFHSYFNSQAQQLILSGAILRSDFNANPTRAVAEFTGRFMAYWILPAAATTMAMSWGDEDKEDWQRKYLRAIALYGFGFMPVVRDVGPYWWGKVDPDPTKMKTLGFRMSPITAAVEGVAKGGAGLADIAGGEADDKDIKAAIYLPSFLFGLPGKLIADTTLGTKAWLSGEAGPEAIAFGPPK